MADIINLSAHRSRRQASPALKAGFTAATLTDKKSDPLDLYFSFLKSLDSPADPERHKLHDLLLQVEHHYLYVSPVRIPLIESTKILPQLEYSPATPEAKNTVVKGIAGLYGVYDECARLYPAPGSTPEQPLSCLDVPANWRENFSIVVQTINMKADREQHLDPTPPPTPPAA